MVENWKMYSKYSNTKILRVAVYPFIIGANDNKQVLIINYSHQLHNLIIFENLITTF